MAEVRKCQTVAFILSALDLSYSLSDHLLPKKASYHDMKQPCRDKSSWVRLEVGLPKATWNTFRSRSSPAEPSEDSSAIQRFDCYIVRGNFFLSDTDSTQERPSYRALEFLGGLSSFLGYTYPKLYHRGLVLWCGNL